MAATITREVLEAHLKCRHKAHLKLSGERGERSDYELLQAEARERVRRAATGLLLARHPQAEVVRGVVTPAILKRAAPLLLDVTVEGEGFSVRLDGLLRKPGPSQLGDFHYLPVLFHETERPGREHRALLESLALLLHPLQGKPPATGVLIHGQACTVRRVMLGAATNQARRTWQELLELRAATSLPRLVLNPHCQVCEFRRRCHDEATARDDLSLLRAVTEKEVKKYERRGIFTVTQLSCTFRPRRRPKHQKQHSQPHQHALKALAVREKRVYVLGAPELPPSPVRVYLDVEGDPERGFDYLVGLIVHRDGAEERHSFWTDGPADEPRLLHQFLDVVGRHDDFRVFTYGAYEAAFLRRLARGSGREELATAVLARTVNVLSVVRAHVYFPTHSNGLKDVAGYLGCRWTAPDASGIQSLVWRRRWEEIRPAALKEKLVTYNLEDCAALKRVTDFVYACARPPQPGGPENANPTGLPVARVEDIDPQLARPNWGDMAFALPDFSFVNERAYFDYQREKVYVRTSAALKRGRARRKSRQGKKDLHANRHVEIRSEACPSCGGMDLTRRQHGSLARLALDLRVTRGGVRRWVTRYTTAWHHCAACGGRFVPADYLRLEEFCHSLKSWAMYEYVAHRTSLANVADTLRESFGLPIHTSQTHAFKELLADYYRGTYRRLLEKIVGGPLVHADETEVHVRRVGKAYVWVFTNLEEVVYLYRPSREGDFLHDLLKGFSGVLVSDFYAAYDSLGCPQQKCLVHLIRDLNQDILRGPWDEELKSLASAFGALLRAAVATIDRYGLKARHLGKHRRDVEKFFEMLAAQGFRSEAAEGCRKRLLKYRDKLFTFLDHDGVPWNNNNAEHAVKGFAHYREVADSLVSEAGLGQYLVLLSVYQTCKYKGVSFLKFLLSRETDIDEFRRCRTKRVAPAIELYPEGSTSGRPSRKRLVPGVQGSGTAADPREPEQKGAAPQAARPG